MSRLHHTPGPWTTKTVTAGESLEYRELAHQVVIGGRAFTVASTRHQKYAEIGREKLTEDSVRLWGVGSLDIDDSIHPDALLASAAPEMYDACRTVLAFIQQQHPNYRGLAICLLRDVIAKVEGGTP